MRFLVILFFSLALTNLFLLSSLSLFLITFLVFFNQFLIVWFPFIVLFLAKCHKFSFYSSKNLSTVTNSSIKLIKTFIHIITFSLFSVNKLQAHQNKFPFEKKFPKSASRSKSNFNLIREFSIPSYLPLLSFFQLLDNISENLDTLTFL